jgi:hypothetical protein
MSDNEACLLKCPTRTPWDKGNLIGRHCARERSALFERRRGSLIS